MTQPTTTPPADHSEPLSVFQTKADRKGFYNKLSHVNDLLAEHREGPVHYAGLDQLDATPGEKVFEIGGMQPMPPAAGMGMGGV